MKRETKRKKKMKPELIDADKIDKELLRHYAWLLVVEGEHEKKMRDKALKLARARQRKKQIGWVI